MSKGIFVTATGTDVGKTYVTALMIKKLRKCGYNACYYKAALSGAATIADSDAGYVNKIADINQNEKTMISYLYNNAVSPHLAARLEGNSVEMSTVVNDYNTLVQQYDYVTVEGSGGIICPIRYDGVHIFLADIIKQLGLNTIIVADCNLGTINSTVLTYEYLKQKNIVIKGIIFNKYTNLQMQNDNIYMIKQLTKLPVIAVVHQNDVDLNVDIKVLENIYE